MNAALIVLAIILLPMAIVFSVRAMAKDMLDVYGVDPEEY